jgi:putative sporulation protein YyaC
MTSKNFSFSTFSSGTSDYIFQALKQLNIENKKPIIICIGSDLVLGDSLGPLVGTMLKTRGAKSYVYGTLNLPITAKEVEYAGTYLKQMHPNTLSIAIDAAVGNADDIGLIRIIDKGLKPGLGVNKNLGEIGDISIIAVVAAKSLQNKHLFNLTRLNLVYKMAESIAKGIEKYLDYLSKNVNFDKEVFGQIKISSAG